MVLDKYLGIYSTPDIPIKLTITKNGNKLIGQGTDQPSFELEAIGKNSFSCYEIGLTLEFNTNENSMLLNQGGQQFTFKRKESN